LQLGTLGHELDNHPHQRGKHDGKNRKTKEERTEDNKHIKEEEKCRERGLTRLYQIIQKILNFETP
jgi:hypothetical protein